MKTAFSTLGCPDWKWTDIISTAKDMGFDGVEVRGVGNTIFAPDIAVFAEDKIEATVEKLKNINLDLPCISSACLLFKDDDKIIAEGKQYIDLANKLGAKFIRLLADEKPEPCGPVDDEIVIKNVKILSDYAKNTSLTLLIESNGVYADSKRLAKLMEKIDCENVKVLWDVNHPFRFFNETPAETYANIGKYLKYVHLKDSMVDNGKIKYKMMGYGDIPLKETFTILKKSGYDGYLSLEWVKRWCADLEDGGVVFLQYLSYVKRTWASVK